MNVRSLVFYTNALIVCVAVSSLHTTGAHAGTPHEPPPEAQEAARNGNETLKAMIIKLLEGQAESRRFLDEFGMIGIETETDVQKLKLGSPLPTYKISLNELQKLQTWGDLRTVLKDERYLYPIKTQEEIRCSLSVAPSPGATNWVVTDWTNGKLVSRIHLRQLQFPNATAILWFPGLKKYFIFDESDASPVIIPVDLIGKLLPAPTPTNLLELKKEANDVLALRKQTAGKMDPDKLVR